MTQDIIAETPAPSQTTATAPMRSRRQHKRRQQAFEWLPGPYDHTRGEKALWAAVIMQAVIDAMSNARNAEANYHKHEAMRWLTGNSADFVTVCLLAGFEPGYIRCQAKKALLRPRSWRAAAGQGVRYLERKRYRERARRQPAQDPAPSSNVIVGPWISDAPPPMNK